jgi:ADP-heptose:LPS heptosyltransferase
MTNKDRIVIPATMLPSFRTGIAVQNKVEKNLLFVTWGGLGDQICAEPTLRYALKTFKGCKISLASEHPELFKHLEFDEVFDLKKVQPNYDNYLRFDTIVPPNDTNLTWQFFSHMVTNCVDFPSLCAYRCQLPVSEKEIKLFPETPKSKQFIPERSVFIHAGRHWQSKTFPKSFWDAVLKEIKDNGAYPILIGADTDDNRGTVDVETDGCIDLRNKLSIDESIYYLQNAKVLLTNDSSPLHMAASGDAWIGFIATCKHPDYISHWRNGQWAYKMVNHGKGGIWDILDYCPNKENKVEVENVGEHLIEWLPDPKEYAKWALSKLE